MPEIPQTTEFFQKTFQDVRFQACLVLIGLVGMGVGVFFLLNEPDFTQDLVQNMEENEQPMSSPSHSESPVSDRATVAVSIAGAVKKPGVYILSSDSRIGDALASSSGYAKDVNRYWVDKYLHLAEKAQDEMHLYIPRMTDPPESHCEEEKAFSQETSATSPQSINTVSKEELMTIKGVGESRANEILEKRPFADEADFRSRINFSENILNEILRKYML